MHVAYKVFIGSHIYELQNAQKIGVSRFLPLDVDSINENDSVANPDPTPRIASVH